MNELPKLYTMDEAAAYLGVTTKSLYNMRHAGRAPKGFKVGKRVRFTEEALKDYIAKCAEAAK